MVGRSIILEDGFFWRRLVEGSIIVRRVAIGYDERQAALLAKLSGIWKEKIFVRSSEETKERTFYAIELPSSGR